MAKKKETTKKRKSSAKKSDAKLVIVKPKKLKKPNLTIKNPKRAIAFSVTLLVIALIATWWQFVFAEPNRVMSEMLINNLRTPGVVKIVKQGDGQNTVDQNTYLSFIDGPKSQAKTVLEQAAATGGTSRVVTENIGLPTEDFIRYREIDVPEGLAGINIDEVENVWALRPVGGEDSMQAGFLSEGLFGVIAFGNFNSDQASQLKETLDNNKVYNYSSVEKKFEKGRMVYEYQVVFEPAALIGYLAEYSKMLGMQDSGQLDPENYKNAQPVRATFKIDVLSRQLRSIAYGDSGRVEEYGSYGLKRPVEAPTDSIPVSELQQRLQPAR